jgi:predicted transcriptional regulator
MKMNTRELRKRIKESGYTFKYIAEHSQMSRQALYGKINRKDFNVSDARRIADTLKFTEDDIIKIFFKDF